MDSLTPTVQNHKLQLLIGAGLMMRSFSSLVETDPGFASEGVWSLQFQINFEDFESLAANRQRLVEIARDVPGVLSVGGSKTPLLAGGGEAYEFTAIGPTGDQVSVTPESGTYMVLPGFFETLGARFVTGRRLPVEAPFDSPGAQEAA